MITSTGFHLPNSHNVNLYTFSLTDAAFVSLCNHSRIPIDLTFKQIREREMRTNGLKYYNFTCKSERFKQSPIVYAIDKPLLLLYYYYL